MAQHFLESKAARTLSLAQVFRMSDGEAETFFKKIRWHESGGEPSCPKCGVLKPYEFRRKTGALRFECRDYKAEFSITSGTIFASHKLPLRTYLAAIAIFINEGKGKSALAISRDLRVGYKSCWVLLHKLRESISAEMKDRIIGGDGKVAELDGGLFGGYSKPANLAENRRDRRLRQNQTGKRQVVVVIRERGGNSLPAVFKSETAAGKFICSRVAMGTILNADEAGAWDHLHERFEVRRINHEEAYSLDDACTN
jgi:ISXO2-like transposase domain/Transposase zinc-ribbon domain